MKNYFLLIAFLFAVGLYFLLTPQVSASEPANARFWAVQSIDTMKHSRDAAKQNWPKELIRLELQPIKEAGATHVAIATPYDEEFVPVLQSWVEVARELGLNVWFRGNFSGWEGWFGYAKDLTRPQHLEKTEAFILNHADLFENGDGFTPCPECENGGPGDPRNTGDVQGYRQFIIDQYQLMNRSFTAIGKSVHTNWFSMNGDIAREVMDKPTYDAIGGLATIDHYVATSEKFEKDLNYIHDTFGVTIMLGEFGAPIPDLHGAADEKTQDRLVREFMEVMYVNRDFIRGMNYWTFSQSSTALVDSNLNKKKAYDTLKYFWNPGKIQGNVSDTRLDPIMNTLVQTQWGDSTTADVWGNFYLILLEDQYTLTYSAPGFVSQNHDVAVRQAENVIINQVLEAEFVSPQSRLMQMIYELIDRLRKAVESN